MRIDRKLREIFHFCFLERLLKLSDPALYILKGGVNLRFFLHSPRYSEDMDIDVVAGSVETLKKNSYKILNDPSFQRLLLTYGIRSIEPNNPGKAKQTDTTQRFKVGLITMPGERLPTKVEFSRRQKKDNAILERLDTEIARQYNRLAYRCYHYTGEAMVLQKMRALLGRTVTQARDLFDLHLLHTAGYTQKCSFRDFFLKKDIQSVRERISGITVDDYRGQVLEFLDEKIVGQYETSENFIDMQNDLLALLSI